MSLTRALQTAALVIAVSGCKQSPPIDGKLELSHAEALQKSKGPEAGLTYLLSLPRTSAEGQYNRLRAIARLEDSLGRWEDADKHLQEGVKVSRDANNSKLAANGSTARFSILMKLRRFEEAERCLDAARDYSRTAHDASLEPFILHDQGLLLEKSGHFEEAVGPIRRSLKLFERANQPGHAANVRISLAWAFWQLGQYDLASDQLTLAQKQALPRDQHLSIGHLGNLSFQQRNFKDAVAFYRNAAEAAKDVDQDNYSRWLTNEATGWIELGDLRKASQTNQLALAAGDRLPNMSARSHALLNRARIAARNHETNQAITQLRAIASAAQDPSSTLDAYSELAHIYQQAGKTAEAHDAYLSGLDVVNRERTGLLDLENKLSFSASVMKLNQQYIADLVARGRAEEAFETAEASRASMLRGSLSLVDAHDSGPRLAAYREAAGRTGSAYFAYWLAPEHSYLWVITGQSFACYPLPDEGEIRDRIDRYQKLVQERGDADAEGAALFRTLVAPARKQLGKIAQVVIVPDGPLYSMNFETLRQGGAASRYWIQDATISIAPSLSLMIGKTSGQITERRMLLLGDAIEWSADFPRLLNSPGELDRIAAHFENGKRTRLTQTSATPAEYERQPLAAYRYIHFATHAAANRSAPLESAIILSQAKGRGTLTARDVLAKPISAELVSISACRSAGSRTYEGEGLVGLAWAFLHSGAHSVVAGLWDVSDYSSPLIMGELYGGLANGLSAPEALRAAKLELLKPGSKYADPYYWGPFLLYRGAGAS